MNLPLKISLPPLLGLMVILAVLHLHWAPLQIERAKVRFEAHAHAQLQAAESALVNHLLSHDLAAVVGNLSMLQAQREGEWFNLQLYDEAGMRLYPLFAEPVLPQRGQEFIRHEHALELSGTRLGHLLVDLNWSEVKQQVVADVSNIRDFMLLMIGSVLLLMLVSSYRYIIRPMRQLGQATAQIAGGKWDLSLPAVSRDEIGQLSQDFRVMAREVQFRDRALNNHAILSMTNAKGAIIYVNQGFVDITGYSAEELIGQTHRLIKSDVHDQAYYQNLWQTIQQGQTWRGDFCNHKRSGERFWVSTTITPLLDEQGRPERYLSLNTDVTQQKQAELAMRVAREAAESASRMKSEFLANMSHEIRTPMNTIIGMSQLALETQLNERQFSYIRRVNQAAESLLGIINDILDFSKIEANKLELEEHPFDLNEVLDSLDNLIGYKADEKGLELLFDVDRAVPRRLIGDPTRLNQILVNLANNAIKFTEQGDIISGVGLDWQKENELQLHSRVKDSGIGMNAESQARLFQSFSQADGSITRTHGGTGLGLAICKRLTLLMGGDIWVESEPGQGSTFHFTLRCGWLERSGQQPLAPSQALADSRLLLVDDNDAAREVLSHMARDYQLQVDCTASGEEALAALAQAETEGRAYDLVLLDWQMPQMDGYECAQRIIELYPEPPRIIMISAHGRELLLQKAREERLPIAAVLHKPVTASTLLETLMEAMGQEMMRRRIHHPPTDYHQIAAQLAGANLLLVEDNAFNQELALELLRNNAINVELAVNGQAALDRLDHCSFDGVLMDCQMPVMDGYTATRRIRQQERFKDLPIIAMTANAMVEDVQKALEAGMNDHIAKPINVREMFTTLAKWIKPQNPLAQALPVQAQAPAASSSSAQAVLPRLETVDTQRGLERLDGDVELYLNLLQIFRHNQANTVEDLRQALNAGDRAAATRTAHSLKGTAGTIGASQLQALSLAMELDLKQGLDIDPQRLDQLQAQLQLVLGEIAPLLNPSTSSESAEPLEPKELQRLIELLAAALQDYSVDSKDKLEQIIPHLPAGELRDLFQAMGESLDGFDFDKAQELLAQARQKL
ncbi:MAG: response regulator [Gammaproteobacteria bacterium]|nr:response regulator [Gammaproteobacteria bacterium]